MGFLEPAAQYLADNGDDGEDDNDGDGGDDEDDDNDDNDGGQQQWMNTNNPPGLTNTCLSAAWPSAL